MTQSECGIETILHLTCTDVEGGMIDDALKSAKAWGIQNSLLRAEARAIFCFVVNNARDIYQDPPRGSEYWIPADLRFVHAQDLVSYTRTSPEHSSHFCVGVAGYPDRHPDQEVNEEEDLVYLGQKIDAGADYIITQLFYNRVRDKGSIACRHRLWVEWNPHLTLLSRCSPVFCVAPTAVIEVELSSEVPFPELIEALERIEGKAGKKEK
ncbi:FAD-linked oxidoreductase-like protein [Gautieria morchelliformis]|nr:FAD-linked oxidoreductase-like protein [Gautieria morchelliformis]